MATIYQPTIPQDDIALLCLLVRKFSPLVYNARHFRVSVAYENGRLLQKNTYRQATIVVLCMSCRRWLWYHRTKSTAIMKAKRQYKINGTLCNTGKPLTTVTSDPPSVKPVNPGLKNNPWVCIPYVQQGRLTGRPCNLSLNIMAYLAILSILKWFFKPPLLQQC